jgi:hypothetical protein
MTLFFGCFFGVWGILGGTLACSDYKRKPVMVGRAHSQGALWGRAPWECARPTITRRQKICLSRAVSSETAACIGAGMFAEGCKLPRLSLSSSPHSLTAFVPSNPSDVGDAACCMPSFSKSTEAEQRLKKKHNAIICAFKNSH